MPNLRPVDPSKVFRGICLREVNFGEGPENKVPILCSGGDPSIVDSGQQSLMLAGTSLLSERGSAGANLRGEPDRSSEHEAGMRVMG